MMMARHFWSLGEAVAGGLYLFTGVVHLLLVAFVSYRMLKRGSTPA